MHLSEPATKTWMKTDHIVGGEDEAQMPNDSSFSQCKLYVDIHGGSLDSGRQTTVE